VEKFDTEYSSTIDRLRLQLRECGKRNNELAKENRQLRRELIHRTSALLPCPECGHLPQLDRPDPCCRYYCTCGFAAEWGYGDTVDDAKATAGLNWADAVAGFNRTEEEK